MGEQASEPEHDAGGGSGDNPDEQSGYAEAMRVRSAFWLSVAEQFHPEEDESVKTLERLGLPAGDLRDIYTRIREKALFTHSMYSAQARSYDDMIAAGGPDNPEAYELYEQANEFYAALLATPGNSDDHNDGSA